MNHSKIYYSFRTPGDSLAQRGKMFWIPPDSSYLQMKDWMINLLKQQGIPTQEIPRPEIFKHEISFTFLPDFKPGNLHLIFKPLEYVRPLKRALNIWVMAPIRSKSDVPRAYSPLFENPHRMLSLVDEIWVRFEADRHLLEGHCSRTILVMSRESLGEISSDLILERIGRLQGP
jgi:hypothetical protein